MNVSGQKGQKNQQQQLKKPQKDSKQAAIAQKITKKQVFLKNFKKVFVKGGKNCIMHLVDCGSSSVGRAQPCHGWGREFEPRFPLQSIITQFWAGVAQLVEHNLAMVGVASSNLVSRSKANSQKHVS